MHITNGIVLALFGGLFPAILWLWLWLREDNIHPEPRKRILLAFLYGMLVIPFAFLIQVLINDFILHNQSIHTVLKASPGVAFNAIILWALSEEFVKYIAAYYAALQFKVTDEPIDVMIYLITAALGFAALENTFYILTPIMNGDTLSAFITGNQRFIGSTLLHVASSATLGAFVAFSFFKLKGLRKEYLIAGFVCATTLHALFNLIIIMNEEAAFYAFLGVWIIIILIILLFERVKQIHLNKMQ